jgi:uncharacterized membrane protein HdeD (DUF308 family)
MSSNSFLDNPLAAGINEIRSYWGRFLALGIVTVALGVVCILYNAIATQASVVVLAVLLMISAIVSLVLAFWVRNWNGFFMFFLSALLQGFTGYLLVRYPHQSTIGLTMVLASLFIVGGLFQTVTAGLLRFPAWLWSLLSGVISLALGIFVLYRMQNASIFFLGLVVGVDFVVDGISFIAFGSELHKIPKFEVYKPKAA